tara:strand:- start:495 stop:659 length:165 start_codon:yes stop_codon:yes gene_type:complete
MEALDRLKELELCEDMLKDMMEKSIRIYKEIQDLKNENEELKQQLIDRESWWKW